MTALENHAKQLVSTGELLKNTWKIYKTNYQLILGYASWLLVPFVIHLLISITFNQEIIEISYLVTTGIELLLALWISVLIISLTPHFRDKKIRATKKLSSQSWKLIIPFLLARIAVGLAITAGIILLIIPGIIFSVWLIFTEKIVVLEGSSIKGAFKKSKDLVKNRFFLILGQYVSGELIIIFIFLILISITYLIIGPLQGVSFEMMLKAPPTVIGQAIEYILTIIFLPAFLIFETLLYLSAKESR